MSQVAAKRNSKGQLTGEGPIRGEIGAARCRRCLEWKTVDQFKQDRRGMFGIDYTCKPCFNLVNCRNRSRPTYEQRRREKNTAWQRKLRRKYGINEVIFDDLLRLQEGVCVICKTRSTSSARATTLGVDHDHKTGLVRGLLCGSCNSGIGYFRDNPSIALSAYRYLSGDQSMNSLNLGNQKLFFSNFVIDR